MSYAHPALATICPPPGRRCSLQQSPPHARHLRLHSATPLIADIGIDEVLPGMVSLLTILVDLSFLLRPLAGVIVPYGVHARR